MKKLYSPENNVELAIIESMLDGEGIIYFVHNDYFGTLKVGPKIDLFNAKTIMVSEDQYEIGKEIIDDFLKTIKTRERHFKSRYSLMDKIRIITEIIMMAWCVPGHKWKKNSY